MRYHLTQDTEEGGSATLAANTPGRPLVAQRFCFFWGWVTESRNKVTKEV